MRWEIAQWFEKRWWKRYLKYKSVEEYLNWKTSYWNTFSERINFKPKEGQKILDAGCGPAGIYTFLNQHQVTAIDPLLTFYEHDLKHFKRSTYPNVSFVESPIEKLDFKHEFDVVFCLNVINHVEDIKLAISKLDQSLKPFGTLVLSIDTHNFNFIKWLFRLVRYIDILHPYQYDLEEYTTMFASKGYTLRSQNLIKEGFLFNYYALVYEKM